MSSLIRRMSSRFKTSNPDHQDQTRGRSRSFRRPKKRLELTDSSLPNDTPSTIQPSMINLFQDKTKSSDQATELTRTLYEIPQPEQVDAMTDLIKQHKKGDLFQYVGVVGSEGETPDARRTRLISMKPNYNKRDFPEIKVLGCPLISREGSFTMSKLMDFAKLNTGPAVPSNAPLPSGFSGEDFTLSKRFVHVRQVTIIFTPNVSSTSNYCNFWMNLVDNRLIHPEKGSQTAAVVSNQEGILEMSCDYCIAVTELNNFSISYTLEREIVGEGFQWGTVSFFFNITESDLPYQTSKVDAMAVYRMPITTLAKRDTNADIADVTFTPQDLVALRKMYEEGDIVDVDQPQMMRARKSQYSKSMRSKPKGEEIGSGIQDRDGWSHLAGARKPEVDAMEASIDPDDDDDVPIREPDWDEVERQRKLALERYKEEQEEARAAMEKEVVPLKSAMKKVAMVESDGEEEDERALMQYLEKKTGLRSVGYGPSGV